MGSSCGQWSRVHASSERDFILGEPTGVGVVEREDEEDAVPVREITTSSFSRSGKVIVGDLLQNPV